ncbi:MAG: arylsulfatase [Rikenellaceae bacterium]
MNPHTFTALSLLSSLAISSVEAAEKPNVIFIMADDLGYGDTGCYGATLISTPNIDKLAEQGRRFTDAHSASAVSTPSRYSMLTGEYPFRGDDGRSETGGIWGPLKRESFCLIRPNTQTVASMMQEQGYKTACIGKWHLGFGDEEGTNWNEELGRGANEAGFDYYFGLPFVSSAPPYVLVRNNRVLGLDPNDPILPIKKGETPVSTPIYVEKSNNIYKGGQAAHDLYKDDELGELFVEDAKKWINENKDTPFFVYFASPHIHHPFTPNERFKGSSKCGVYGDFIQEFDWMVGELMKGLEDAGIADNTLIILTSDNGAMFNMGGQDAWDAGHKINGDLLGFKFDVWEGGHRVPYIASWKGHIEEGTVSDQVISNIDLFATLAAITGYKLKDGEAPDSYNVLNAFTGKASQKKMVRDHLLLSSYRQTHQSLRMGDWIYIPKQGGGGWSGGKRGAHIFGGAKAITYSGHENSDIVDGKIRDGAPSAQLYNIATDPGQTKNVVDENPKIVAKMVAKLEEIHSSQKTRK